MANSQAMLFLLFALDGVIIGILFDFFRILRRSFSTGSILTAIEDILFWVSSGIILLYSIFVYNNGAIRGYMFLGVLCGATLYMITLSKLFIKVNVSILNFIKKIITIILKIINIPIRIVKNILTKTIFKPISFIFVKSDNFVKKNIKKSINILKINNKAKKKEYKEGF